MWDLICRVDTFRVLQMEDGKLRKILNVSQEVSALLCLPAHAPCAPDGKRRAVQDPERVSFPPCTVEVHSACLMLLSWHATCTVEVQGGRHLLVTLQCIILDSQAIFTCINLC